jgi:integrase
MVSALRLAAENGELEKITRPGEIDRMLDELMRPEWVVFSKPCPAQTGTVIDYLARYSHRIAISDQRIVADNKDTVRFRYKDYAGGGERKVMLLSAVEFIRRYLLHVLPKGLMRIRHYGFLANCCRRKKLAQVRRALGQCAEVQASESGEAAHSVRHTTNAGYPCPQCRTGRLLINAPVRRLREG